MEGYLIFDECTNFILQIVTRFSIEIPLLNNSTNSISCKIQPCSHKKDGNEKITMRMCWRWLGLSVWFCWAGGQAIVRYLKRPSIIVVGKEILTLWQGSRQLSDELSITEACIYETSEVLMSKPLFTQSAKVELGKTSGKSSLYQTNGLVEPIRKLRTHHRPRQNSPRLEADWSTILVFI